MQLPVSLFQIETGAAGETLGKITPSLSTAAKDVLLNEAGKTTASSVLPLQTLIVILLCLAASGLFLLFKESRIEKRDI